MVLYKFYWIDFTMRIIVFKFCKNIADYEFRFPWIPVILWKNFQYNLAWIYFQSSNSGDFEKIKFDFKAFT